MRKLVLATAITGMLGSALAAGAEETTHKFGYKPDEFEIKFYMQPRYTFYLDGANKDMNTFQVRRGRVYLTSKIAPNVKGRIQAELKPESVKALDVFFEWTYETSDEKKPLKATIGQFKKPFSYQELIMASNKLNMIDRTVGNAFLEKNLYASARDQGLMLTLDLNDYDTPVKVYAGLFNGNGPGHAEDDNNGKQIVVRGSVTPGSGLSFGANAAQNRLGDGTSAENFVMWGVDGVYSKSGLTLVSEVFGGENYEEVVSGNIPSTDPVPDFLSVYGEAIYRTVSGWEPGARVEWFDPDTDTDDDEVMYLTGQIAKSFSENFRWQVNVIFTDPSDAAAESETVLISQWTVRL